MVLEKTRAQTLPACLQPIWMEATRYRPPENTLDRLRRAWKAHLAQARQRVPDVRVQGQGEGLYLGELSPGCRACKEGAWDCIFTTMRCNLDCPFCYSPHAIPQDFVGSAFGTTPGQIAANHARTEITGISFSGGEPFTDVQALFEWVAWFTRRCPDKYYWVYTNGLLADEKHLERLGTLGVHEIRFNVAATGYDHPTVTENLGAAVRLIPHVTVEIPAVPEHADKLLSCLENWCAQGVHYLNLHELIYEPGTNSASMRGARQSVVTEDGHRSAYNPQSRALTLAVMERVQKQGLPLSVNDCSLQSKLGQLRGRRQSLAPLTKAPHERLLDGESYESYCAYHAGQETLFFDRESLPKMRRRYPERQFARLVRTAPLSLHGESRWIVFETLDNPVATPRSPGIEAFGQVNRE